MEFRFDVRPIFTNQIVRINSNLLPSTFVGDRRMAIDMANKVSQIINEMGEASAKAQGLNKPVTTSQKLRLTDQMVYLLGDNDHGRHGAVVGLLKVGQKSLYVFDENGETKMVDAPCVLDFYVHESRQRSGLGKTLFETMLREENYKPEKLAIDRPSDKLIGFLRKHYGLEKTIPQMNNFVVYEGFFGNPSSDPNSHDGRMHMTAGPNTALFGPQFINDECKKRASKSWEPQNSPTTIPLVQSSPVGRYAAPRPMCSMAEERKVENRQEENKIKIEALNDSGQTSECMLYETCPNCSTTFISNHTPFQTPLDNAQVCSTNGTPPFKILLDNAQVCSTNGTDNP